MFVRQPRAQFVIVCVNIYYRIVEFVIMIFLAIIQLCLLVAGIWAGTGDTAAGPKVRKSSTGD